jgi:hypothetical protein
MPIFQQPRELKGSKNVEKSTHAYGKLNIGGGKP